METSFPKQNIKILLLEGVHQSAIEVFNAAGYYNIESIKGALTEQELLQKLTPDVKILGIRSKTQITQKVINHCNKLMAIGCFCIGTNQVNLDAATNAGIAVFNSPYCNTRSVAELVIAEVIMLLRRIVEKNNAAHNGLWLKDTKGSNEVRGKTLGIVGYGHIGSQVSILAEALGMKVIYYDVVPKLPLGNANAVKTLSDLLSVSDVVSLHVPEIASTKNLITASTLSAMKKGAVLLNLSRGTVVDVEALAESLKSKHLSGAAIDVFPDEPASEKEKFISLLQQLPNVILTPHIGGSTLEAQESIGRDAAYKLVNYLDLGDTVGSYTVPEINLPPTQNAHRILHIHKNVPGMLLAINKIISGLHANIVGQYLKTNEKIGYVVFDVEAELSSQVLEDLKQISNTIKARMLY